MTEAKLGDKDKGMILDVTDDIVALATKAVDENNAAKKAKIAAGETLTNAQKSKAVLVTYKNVSNINAETVVSRYRDLRNLYNNIHDLDNVYRWRIPIDNIRPTINWAGQWSQDDDAMLLVGAYLHGFGNWEQMVKDPKLGLEGKFFLEEAKKGEENTARPIPNAIHLVRRGDFLLGLLREHDEKIRSYESNQRHKGSKVSESPAPAPVASSSGQNIRNGSKKRADSEAIASVEDANAKKRKRRPTPTFTDSESSDDWYVPLQCRQNSRAYFNDLAPPWTKQLSRRSYDQSRNNW